MLHDWPATRQAAGGGAQGAQGQVCTPGRHESSGGAMHSTAQEGWPMRPCVCPPAQLQASSSAGSTRGMERVLPGTGGMAGLGCALRRAWAGRLARAHTVSEHKMRGFDALLRVRPLIPSMLAHSVHSRQVSFPLVAQLFNGRRAEFRAEKAADLIRPRHSLCRQRVMYKLQGHPRGPAPWMGEAPTPPASLPH